MAMSVAPACNNRAVIPVPSPTGAGPRCGGLFLRQKVDMSSDSLRCHSEELILLSAFLSLSHLQVGPNSSFPETLGMLHFDRVIN